VVGGPGITVTRRHSGTRGAGARRRTSERRVAPTSSGGSQRLALAQDERHRHTERFVGQRLSVRERFVGQPYEERLDARERLVLLMMSGNVQKRRLAVIQEQRVAIASLERRVQEQRVDLTAEASSTGTACRLARKLRLSCARGARTCS
jgi:hypothetical protein